MLFRSHSGPYHSLLCVCGVGGGEGRGCVSRQNSPVLLRSLATSLASTYQMVIILCYEKQKYLKTLPNVSWNGVCGRAGEGGNYPLLRVTALDSTTNIKKHPG